MKASSLNPEQTCFSSDSMILTTTKHKVWLRESWFQVSWSQRGCSQEICTADQDCPGGCLLPEGLKVSARHRVSDVWHPSLARNDVGLFLGHHSLYHYDAGFITFQNVVQASLTAWFRCICRFDFGQQLNTPSQRPPVSVTKFQFLFGKTFCSHLTKHIYWPCAFNSKRASRD